MASRFALNPVLSASSAFGVGRPVESVPDVRGTDARRAEYRSPDGVTCSFQISVYKVEPRPASRAFNLLSNER